MSDTHPDLDLCQQMATDLAEKEAAMQTAGGIGESSTERDRMKENLNWARRRLELPEVPDHPPTGDEPGDDDVDTGDPGA